MSNPPFKSDLFYAVQNEDYQTELTVLRRIYRGDSLRVLMVASSGENALSLLTQDIVASVDAVDLNPAQLHLCELRRTALEHLSRDEQLQLLGPNSANTGLNGASLRLTLYDRIQPYLPESDRTYWNARREREIAFGIHHVGRNDIAMHDIRESLGVVGFEPLRQPLKNEQLSTWRAVYTDLMTPTYIRDIFGLPSEELAAKIAGIAGYLGECHFCALQQPHAERNPFLTTVFANEYATAAGEEGFPLYLQAQGQLLLQQLGTQSRLRLHAGNLLEQMTSLAEAYGPFDLISLSNIADWLTEAQFSATVVQVGNCLNSGGALLARTATGKPMIGQVMARYRQTDPPFNLELSQVERGPWFRTIAVGFCD